MSEPFSNKVILGKRPNKPNIKFMRGYWRVSPKPLSWTIDQRWDAAHEFAFKMNEKRI
ncbi:hypothetical protein [Xanthomonas phage XAJ2]|uniref:Uncharacterized protein n=1 Tax=Xanthomonas phage XAJ2 TaxID=1775249 RepID=A0A1I9L2I2_9CAUD|nr:hypothetical protein [Xanthomonas phage XAJ2]